MAALMLLILAAGLFGLGRGFLAACGLRAEQGPREAGLALALGLALAILALYADLALTERVHFPVLFALVAAGLALLARAVHRRALARPDRGAFAIALPLVLLAGWQGAAAWDTPFVGYDCKAIYGIKAKALLHDRSLEGGLFQDENVVHYHGDYPLGVPLLMAATGWWACGRPDESEGSSAASGVAPWIEAHSQIDAYMPVAALWVVALVLMIAGGVAALEKRAVLRIAMLLLAVPAVVVVPWTGKGSWSLAGADLPLAACLGGAALLALDAVAGGRARLLLPAGALALCAVLLKSDAVLGLGALVAALVLLCDRRARAALPAAALVAGGMVGLMLWRAVAARTIGAPFDEDYGAALREADPALVLRRVPVLLASAWDALGDRDLLTFWIAALGVAVPLGLRRGGAPRVLAAWVCLYALLLAGVFLVTPNHIAWHVNTALPRLLCQLVLPAGLLLAAAARELSPSGVSDFALTPHSRVPAAVAPAPDRARGEPLDVARGAALHDHWRPREGIAPPGSE